MMIGSKYVSKSQKSICGLQLGTDLRLDGRGVLSTSQDLRIYWASRRSLLVPQASLMTRAEKSSVRGIDRCARGTVSFGGIGREGGRGGVSLQLVFTPFVRGKFRRNLDNNVFSWQQQPTILLECHTLFLIQQKCFTLFQKHTKTIA